MDEISDVLKNKELTTFENYVEENTKKAEILDPAD